MVTYNLSYNAKNIRHSHAHTGRTALRDAYSRCLHVAATRQRRVGAFVSVKSLIAKTSMSKALGIKVRINGR